MSHIMRQPRRPTVIHKCLDLLLLFLERGGRLGVTEVVKITGIPKSNVSRMLMALADKGFLRKEESGKYSLTYIYHSFSALVSEQSTLVQRARPMMQRLADQFKETIHLNVIDNYERVCVSAIEPPQQLKAVVPIGQRSPLYAGASSKALLAFSDEDVLARVLSKEMAAFTKNTITDANELIAEIEKIRRIGYATSQGERIRGLTSFAIPVQSRYRKLVGSLAVSVPMARYFRTMEKEIVVRLKEESANLSKDLE